MRIIIPLIFLGILVSMAACSDSAEQTQNESTEEVDLRKALEGTWQTYQLNIAVNSAEGLDSFRSEALNQKVWEEKYGIQPPFHYFQADMNYRLVRLDLRGNMIGETKGTWSTIGDTLIIVQPDTTYKYTVKHGNGRAGFRTMIDWDSDGEADDEYQSIHRQISISTN